MMDDDFDDDFDLTSEEADPLDAETFNPVDFINRQFPSEASLGGLDGFIGKLRAQQKHIDEDIRLAVRRQAASGRRARADLDEAKAAVRELFERIKAIKAKAEQSEDLVSDVCRDIKSLDIAKRNLTLTVTALKRLVMLVTALEQLRSLASCRQYQEAAGLVRAVEELSAHFRELGHVPRVGDLLERRAAVLGDLRQQLLGDYGGLLGGARQELAGSWGPSAAGCVDALGAAMRREVVTQFCLRILEDYKEIFQPPNEASGLDTAERRFAWLKRTLREYGEKHARHFPEQWRVPCGLCMHFCHVTRQHLVEILSTSHHTVDPELMVRVLRKSIDFENELARKYPVEDAASRSQDSEEAADFAPRFKGIISECFDAYLGSWVQHEEKQLLEVLERATVGSSDKMVGQDDEKAEEEDESGFEPKYLYSSAPSMFSAMKGSMTKCAGFSTHNTLFDVFQVFRKVMASYVDRLGARLPAKLSAPLDGATVQAVCCVIGTAEYCDETLVQLAESLLRVISADFGSRVTFEQEQELFRNLMNRANQVLVQSVNNSLDEAFTKMTRTNWVSYSHEVGDHSAYVTEISERLSKQFGPIASYLSKIHYRFFCDKFVQAFVARFISEMFKCRKISEQGAQQLLLDTALIKTTLLEAPVIAGKGRQMQTAYSNYVLREMGRAEAMLKVLGAPGGAADLSSAAALLGDRPSAEVEALLALRSAGEGDPQSSPREEERFTSSSMAATMMNFHDAFGVKSAKVSEDFKKLSGDMTKKFKTLGSVGASLPSLGGRRPPPPP